MPFIELDFENPIWGGQIPPSVNGLGRTLPIHVNAVLTPFRAVITSPILKRIYPVRHFLHLLLPQLQWKSALPFSFTLYPQQC